MNVLIAADYSSPYGGNFIASLIALARMLKDQNHKAIFIFPTEAGNREWTKWFEDEGFFIFLFNKSNSEAQCANELLQLVEENCIDIIHLHFGMLHRVVMHNRAKLKNVKIIIHDHMDYSVNLSMAYQIIRSNLRSIMYRFKDISVITVMKKKLNGYLFLKKKWYVPNGLSLERYVKKTKDREMLRKELGVSSNEKLCLLLGWDLERKGIDIAVNAIHVLRKRGVPISLGLVGLEGDLAEKQRSFLAERCDANPDSPWIRYLQSREDMFSLHRAADVYLSASRKEGFSYGILEAISQNKPVVVSNIEGTSWAWEYSKCLHYPVEDVNACADMIEKALQDNVEESNYSQITEKYGIGKWCDRIVNIYNRV